MFLHNGGVRGESLSPRSVGLSSLCRGVSGELCGGVREDWCFMRVWEIRIGSLLSRCGDRVDYSAGVLLWHMGNWGLWLFLGGWWGLIGC
jgi:hypothetical protein